MKTLQIKQEPVGKAELLIRKPAAQVFEAFVNPEITTKFWFTRSSGRLEPGKQVQWVWEMYDVSTPVQVKEVEENKRILVEWGTAEEGPTTVEWVFSPFGVDATFVSVTNAGFRGDGDEIVAQAIGSTEGFTLVLAGLKTYLEHNILLNLIADRFPKGLANTKEDV
jgi:uncharacterized protein YndB with AHSA1/START domain